MEDALKKKGKKGRRSPKKSKKLRGRKKKSVLDSP
jgi:hypothetical protein